MHLFSMPLRHFFPRSCAQFSRVLLVETHAHLFLSYFPQCFVPVSFHRKVEDLQFRVEEESITKGDLEVKPLQLLKRLWVPMFRNVDRIIVPADVARTGSRGMAGAQPLASGAVGMAAGGDGAASEPATEPSHLLWPSKVFTTLSLFFEIQNLKLAFIKS